MCGAMIVNLKTRVNTSVQIELKQRQVYIGMNSEGKTSGGGAGQRGRVGSYLMYNILRGSSVGATWMQRDI